MQAKNKYDCFISVIGVVEQDSAAVLNYVAELNRILDSTFNDYEIIIIDQSNAGTTTESVRDDLLKVIPYIRLLKLAQKVSIDVAYAAGAENAIGDLVVFVNFVTDPVAGVIDSIQKCLGGSDIVIGVNPRQKTTLLYKLLRPGIGYLTEKILNCSMPQNTTNLFCVSRRAVNSIIYTEKFHNHFCYKIINSSYNSTQLDYATKDEDKVLKDIPSSFVKVFQLLVFNSTKPLRVMSALGFAGSVLTFLVSLYTVVVNIVKHEVAEGWTTMMLFLSLMFALIFIILALFGEYLARIFDDSLVSEHYNILFEKNSSVMVDENRHNVLQESTSNEINRIQSGRDR